jgi:hypothetical protein
MHGKLFVLCIAHSVIAFGGLFAAAAQAAPFISDSNLIPAPNEVLASTNKVGWISIAEGGHATSDSVRFFGPTGGVLPPADPGVDIESFFNVFVDISLDGLPGGPLDATVNSTAKLRCRKAGTEPHDYFMEISDLNLTGFTGEPGLMIRESPTLASTGVTTIENLPNGQFRIDSFFDIFTELSLDGGQNWIPADGPIHLESTPEPSTLVLGALGLATLLVAVRRTKLGR